MPLLELTQEGLSWREELGEVQKNIAEAIPQEFCEADGGVGCRQLAGGVQCLCCIEQPLCSGLSRTVATTRRWIPTEILYFCQIASQYANGLDFTDTYETDCGVEYP